MMNVKYESELSELKEYKVVTQKDLRNKNNTLMTAEQTRLQALNDVQLKQYEV